MKVIIVEVTRAANSFGQTHLEKNDEELANRPRVVAVEIDRLAPLVLVRR